MFLNLFHYVLLIFLFCFVLFCLYYRILFNDLFVYCDIDDGAECYIIKKISVIILMMNNEEKPLWVLILLHIHILYVLMLLYLFVLHILSFSCPWLALHGNLHIKEKIHSTKLMAEPTSLIKSYNLASVHAFFASLHPITTCQSFS